MSLTIRAFLNIIPLIEPFERLEAPAGGEYGGGKQVMQKPIDRLLREFKEGLERIYGSRLCGAYLYGSYARGEADEESDVDILIVLEDFSNYGEEVERTGQLGADLSLKHGVSISQVFMPVQDWLHGDTPFLANMREEAVPA